MIPASIVTRLSQPSEVSELPKGAIVGDLVGGRSFNDNIAAALEKRSNCGWQDVCEGQERWTLICLER